MKKMIFGFGILAVLFGCKGTGTESGNDVEREIDALMGQMTLEEKVGQMAQVTLDVITVGENNFVSDEPVEIDVEKAREAIVKYHVGSILNTANNRARTPEKWNAMITLLQEIATKEARLGIPIIYGVDAIHGATYTAGATMFPQQIGMAATWNRNLVRRGAEITAYETRASSIPWTFSPVLDMGIDPRWARHWETFGEDVFLTTEMGVQMIRGYEGDTIGDKNRIASCLKHFLGYSAAFSGKDRTPAYLPENQLREIHLPAFAAAVAEGAHSVMINSGIINGLPVHANKYLITDVLKKELGFEGLVVTDWADIENLHNRDKVAPTHKEAVKMAINAGIDMSMIPYNFNFCQYLVELVNEGAVPMERIDDAVRRVLRLKMKLGLFANPVTLLADYPDFGSPEHEQAAYNSAAESITLLKNEDGLLPLKRGARILVAGPNANSMRTLNGGWTYSWQGEKVEEFAGRYNTIYEALVQRNGATNVRYVPGVEYKMDGSYHEETNVDVKAAVEAARQVDVVVLCLGENTYTEKPGDLNDLNISRNQANLARALAATGKPLVLVLNEGRPRLITDFALQMKAIVMTYLPGNHGGDALADILFGDVNPSGKLPFSYPMYANSLVNYNHKPSENQEKMAGAYDYEGAVNLLYPFGHGLSYTTFEYSALTLNRELLGRGDELEFSVVVKNTGSKAGKEVVQIYFSDVFASLTPDVKRLCAFEKVQLAPGESKELSFQLPLKAFSFVNHNNQRITEAGEFVLMVGGLRQSFVVEHDVVF